MKPERDVAIRVFEDRTPVDYLGSEAEKLVRIMEAWKIGKVGDKDRVHFCGLIVHPEIGTVAFIPITSRTADPRQNQSIAADTMRALSRFGSEVSKREFESDGETGNPGLLAVIRKLAEDFRENGIFSEREKVRMRNSGKIDWNRTISREVAVPGNSGRPVYMNLQAVRSRSRTNAILSRIQAAVIREILQTHGWWLDAGHGRDSELRSVPFPVSRRVSWARNLSRILPLLYSRRSIFLVEYLQYYLDATRSSDSGSYVFGLTDFHSVWEAMLRETLSRPPEDTRRNWNKDLPKPVYSDASGNSPWPNPHSMRTDLIIEGKNKYTLVDAKYYRALTPASAPGWPDIVKQQFYEKGLRSLVGNAPAIDNVFVFPGTDSSGPLETVSMRNLHGEVDKNFPTIRCAYVNVTTVLQHYSNRSKSGLLEQTLQGSIQS